MAITVLLISVTLYVLPKQLAKFIDWVHTQ
jgi:hypothetical protein